MTKVLIGTKLSHLLSSLVLTCMLLANVGCQGPTDLKQAAAKPSMTPALFERGRQLYEKQCAVCHGPSGAGDGPAAYLLSPKPRDFTQGKFRLVSTSTMQATDEDLFLTITRGMPGSAMPSWETLTHEERWALVYYVRYLEEVGEALEAGELKEEEVVAVLPWEKMRSLITVHSDIRSMEVSPEPAVTPESLARGKAIYAQGCAACHGPQGKGDGQQVMVDNSGFPIRPRDLTAGIFKGSSESHDLYYRIVAGLPGSPMPSYAGVFTDEELWALIHYVQSLVPPGAEERVRMHPQTIRVRRVRGELPSDTTAGIWHKIEPVTVALTPLWWRDDRIENVEVKALHNGKELVIHLAWKDPTRDQSTVTQQTFSDGAAVQLSSEEDPPFFGMGDTEGAVRIWHWKASWQEEVKAWRDVEAVYPNAAVDWYEAQRTYRRGEPFEVSESKTAEQDPEFMSGWGAGNPLSNPQRSSAAEEAAAKGLGTITSRPPEVQQVRGSGVWQDGQWQVVLRRPLDVAKDSDLKASPGQKISVAVAVWDGAAHDRNGQKSVSIWNTLTLER